MADLGMFLFLVAMVLAFIYPRVAAVFGLGSALLCLPLNAHFIAPVPFRHLFGFGHESSIPYSHHFYWDRWAMAGLTTLAVTTYLCVGALLRGRRQIPPEN